MTNRAIEKDGVLYFKCRRCGEIKPLNSAYFHRNTTAMMGYNSKCRECVREEMNTIYKPKKRYITKAELEEENRKLKSELEECECSMHFENDEVGYRKRECKKLKEEIRFLEQYLDNKEKVNKSLREELDKLKSTYVYDAKQVRDIC